MKRELFFLALAGLGVFGVACSISKNPMLKLVGAIVFGLLSAATSALTVFLVYVGVKNHWSSDGPGMLMIMLGIMFFGAISFWGWSFVLNMIFDRGRRT